MARRAAKVDANQSAIINALRKVGASVQPLHGVGMGCPDLLVGYRGVNLLMEVKDGDKVPSARKLTSWQKKWMVDWRGQSCVVNSLEDAIRALSGGTAEVPIKGVVLPDGRVMK